MAWEQHEFENMVVMRRFYQEWAADIEAGRDQITTQSVRGVLVDDRDESLARYRRNIDEIEAILKANGFPFD